MCVCGLAQTSPFVANPTVRRLPANTRSIENDASVFLNEVDNEQEEITRDEDVELSSKSHTSTHICFETWLQ